MLQRILAAARANPALAIAGVGLAGVLVIPAIRREPDAAPAPEDPDTYGPGYGSGLMAGGAALESDGLGSQINEGNNFLAGQVNELRNLIAGNTRATNKLRADLKAGRGGSTPTKRPLPALAQRRWRLAGGISRQRAPRALNGNETRAILRIYGAPESWSPPSSARVSAAALVRWIRAERARRRAAREAA